MIQQITDVKVNIKESCCHRNKNNDRLSVYNWLKEHHSDNDLVEVKFKSTRKLYCVNVNGIEITEGDIVAVSSNPGHDIGVVSLTGELVNKQILKKGIKTENKEELPKIYRLAKENDMEKWERAKAKEHDFLLISRSEADRLGLKMKIGDVECQGDGTKAIFYYIAEERVDFRELIKVLAARCCVRIEMKQIGARQEAGRTGGIGSCGRELCCSSWLQDFTSVTNTAVRVQGLSLNPSKITGQCGKIKCCMKYEVATYEKMRKILPDPQNLIAEECKFIFKKLDVLAGIYTFESDDDKQNFVSIDKETMEKYIALNKKRIKIKNIMESKVDVDEPVFTSQEDDIFSIYPKEKKKKRTNSKSNNRNRTNTRGDKDNKGANRNRKNADGKPRNQDEGNRNANRKTNSERKQAPNKGKKNNESADNRRSSNRKKSPVKQKPEAQKDTQRDTQKDT